MQALKGASDLAESRVEHLSQQLTDANNALEQSAHERAGLESKLSASLASKPSIVPMSEVRRGLPRLPCNCVALQVACLHHDICITRVLLVTLNHSGYEAALKQGLSFPLTSRLGVLSYTVHQTLCMCCAGSGSP